MKTTRKTRLNIIGMLASVFAFINFLSTIVIYTISVMFLIERYSPLIALLTPFVFVIVDYIFVLWPMVEKAMRANHLLQRMPGLALYTDSGMWVAEIRVSSYDEIKKDIELNEELVIQKDCTLSMPGAHIAFRKGWQIRKIM